MRIEQLYYLTEVAKTKSISVTAENIYVSQPSISEAIHKLEKELETNLLDRTTQGVSLTKDGEIVVKRASEILKLIDNLKLEFKARDTKTQMLKGSLRISSSPAIAAGILQKLILAFSRDYPHVNLTVKEKLPEKVLLDVKEGKADIGLIVIPDDFLNNSGLTETSINNEIYFERLFYDKLVVGMAKLFPLSNRKSISLKQLLQYPVAINQGEDIEDNWHVKLLRQHGEPKRLLKLESSKLFNKVILEGIAVGFFSKSFLKENYPFKDIIYIPISNNIKLTYGWLRLNNYPFSEAAQKFIKGLKSYC